MRFRFRKYRSIRKKRKRKGKQKGKGAWDDIKNTLKNSWNIWNNALS